jgi:hypothetical protein
MEGPEGPLLCDTLELSFLGARFAVTGLLIRVACRCSDDVWVFALSLVLRLLASGFSLLIVGGFIQPYGVLQRENSCTTEHSCTTQHTGTTQHKDSYHDHYTPLSLRKDEAVVLIRRR